MKSIFFIPVLLLGLLCYQACAQPRGAENDSNAGIQFFEGSWEEALTLAKAENKLIFMDAYARWCGPCKIMARNVFTDPKAGEFFNENFINVKMDMERGEGPALSRKYGVRAYPTLFFIDHTGKVVNSALGYHKTGELIRLGKGVL